jgi:hypothetical protein
VDNEEHRSEEEGEEEQHRAHSQQQQREDDERRAAAAAAAAGRSRAKSSAAAPARGSDSGSLLSPSTSRAKSQHRSWAGLGDISSYDTSYGHPLASPRASRPAATSPGHRSQGSAFSFELAEPGAVAGDDGDEATSLGRRGSSVDPAVVRDMLDDSVWVESLRRSATTMRKSGWGSGGFR